MDWSLVYGAIGAIVFDISWRQTDKQTEVKIKSPGGGNQSHVHMETFSCVFELFQVMRWLFLIPLRTVNNTKTQENVSVCTGPKTLIILRTEINPFFLDSTDHNHNSGENIVTLYGGFVCVKYLYRDINNHCSDLIFVLARRK